MNRRRFIAVAGGLASAPLACWAEDKRRVPVVGFLTSVGVHTERQMREGLRDLGYADGKTIIVEQRSASGNPEALPTLADELVQLNVDVLVATGPPAVRAAKDATRTIPIVAVDLETDPVSSGLVQSLGRPGGNITGFFLDLPDLAGKWLELLETAAPGRRRVGVLWDSTTGPWQLAAVKTAAQKLAIDLQTIEVRKSDDFDAALREAIRTGVKAIVMLSSPIVSGSSSWLAEFTAKNRLPAISPFRIFADSGGLMSYGPDLLDFSRRAASYVDKILKGAKPSDLPIQQPTKFELVMNLKTAKTLGLTIPQLLLLRADEVIQ